MLGEVSSGGGVQVAAGNMRRLRGDPSSLSSIVLEQGRVVTQKVGAGCLSLSFKYNENAYILKDPSYAWISKASGIKRKIL